LVCGGDDQHGVLAVLHSGQGRQGQCRGGVAACGLEQGGAQGHADFAQLFGGQEAVVFTTDDDGGCDLNTVVAQSGQPLRGLLKQAFVAGEAQELFGETGARQRPQTCAGAAAEDDGGDLEDRFWLAHAFACAQVLNVGSGLPSRRLEDALQVGEKFMGIVG